MPADNTGLLADCNTLLPLEATLAGSATLLNWSEDTEIGSWNGITLGGSPQRVTGLVLPSWSLSGSIPSGLGDLSNLTTLNLSGNQLTGTIPSGLGDLSNLTTLNLSGNQLSGTIPSELGDLSSLTTLDLSTNQLHGVIPSDLGGLSNLGTLNLSNNSLGGSIPSRLGNLSNLKVLNLSGNELDWEIPEELNQLDKLEQVWLNGNIGVIGPAHLDFSALSEAHLGYMETETWVVADFSSATSSSVSGGADSSQFAITSGGVLTFKTAPDYEAWSDDDGNNTYEVVVTASAGGVQKTATMYVYVMDRAVALSVSPGSIVEEGSLATTVTLTATLDGGANPNAATTVVLSLSGTATGSGADYSAVVPSQMTIPVASASGTATLSITPQDDAIVEGEETIRVEGTVSGSGSTVSSAWITIDEAERGTLSLSGSGTAVLEGNDASYTVSLSHAIGHEVTVGWSVTPDSGDFISPSGSVTFAAGSSANATTTLTLTATDDLLSEVLESFSVTLGTVTGEISDRISVDPQAGSAEVKIEASDPITVTLSGDSSVDEGGLASYTVSLSPDGVTPTANLTVDYDTADGTAGSADYEGVSETVTLTFTSSDAAAKTVAVQTTEDSIVEGVETFSFTLSNVAGGGGPTPSLDDPSSITTTIIDDDEPTATATPTPAPTATATPTPAPTATATPAPAPTATATPAPAPTATATPAPAPTATATPTPAPTATATPTPAPTATATPAPAPTATATPTPAPTATATPAPAPTATATPAPAPTATATPAPAPTATATPAPAPTATATPTPAPTATATPTPAPTATATPTPAPTATATPTPAPTATATPTPEPTATATPTPAPTATATPTPEPTTTPTAPPLSAPAPTSTLSPPPTSAPIATATPAVTPERRESDSEGGLPWWVILLLSLGGVGVVLFAWVRRRRRQG